MSDDNRISRRSSLRGIATTGALIGAGLGINTVSAGEKEKKDGKKKKHEKKDGRDEIGGVEAVEFHECDSVAIAFEESYVSPADDGHLTVGVTPVGDDSLKIPVSSTNGVMTIPTTDGTDTAVAVPIGDLNLVDGYVEIEAENGSEHVDTTDYVRVEIEKTKENAIVVPLKGSGDGYYKIPIKGGGYLSFPITSQRKKATTIPLENGNAEFSIGGGDVDGYTVTAPVVRERGGYLKTVRVRMYNARKDRIENYERTITVNDLRTSTLHGADDTGDVLAYTFNVYQFFDRPLGAGDEILAVTIDGTTLRNPNDCAEKHRSDSKTGGKVHPKKLGLVPVCVDSVRDVARYRVQNANAETATVAYGVDGTDETGTVSVEPKSATYFEVSAPDGEATVSMYYDETKLERRESATSTACVPRDRIAFNAECVDRTEEKAKFYVHHGTDRDLTFVYHVGETGATGRITVENDLATAETFWVAAPDGEATVSLYYEGEAVSTAESDPDEDC